MLHQKGLPIEAPKMLRNSGQQVLRLIEIRRIPGW